MHRYQVAIGCGQPKFTLCIKHWAIVFSLRSFTFKFDLRILLIGKESSFGIHVVCNLVISLKLDYSCFSQLNVLDDKNADYLKVILGQNSNVYCD